MIAIRSSSFATLLLCAACASAPPAAHKPGAGQDTTRKSPVAQYYPLAIGNEWTYEMSAPGADKKRDTIKIVRQENGWFVDDHRARLRVDADGLRDADRYLLRAPVKQGGKWSAVEDLVVQRFEITAVDGSEVTPAGTFLHVVTVKNEQPLGQGKGKFVTEWSYAPGVGLVRMKTAVDDGQQIVPQVSLALVEYRLVN